MKRYLALQKIVELSSFTKAAEVLNYTQSSISQMIFSLEDELSIKLLIRSRTGVKLTIEGEELYPFIERNINQYNALNEKVKEIRGLDTGIIRIGTISSITCHWLPQLVKEFQEQYPNVEFIFHQGDYSSIQEWIKTGAVDFGFMNPAAVSGLETLPIKDGEMLVVLPVSHHLAKKQVISLKDIASDPIILVEEGHYSEPLEAFKTLDIKANIKYRIHDDYAILTMIEAGMGISILPELILLRTNYNIVSIPVDPPIMRTLAISYKDKGSLPIASKIFIEHILTKADNLP